MACSRTDPGSDPASCFLNVWPWVSHQFQSLSLVILKMGIIIAVLWGTRPSIWHQEQHTQDHRRDLKADQDLPPLQGLCSPIQKTGSKDQASSSLPQNGWSEPSILISSTGLPRDLFIRKLCLIEIVLTPLSGVPLQIITEGRGPELSSWGRGCTFPHLFN